MHFSDFLLMYAQPLVSLTIALVVVWLLAGLLIRSSEDIDQKRFFRLARSVIVIGMMAFTAISLFESAAVHLPRTTIDRSVGDESYRELQNKVEKGENP